MEKLCVFCKHMEDSGFGSDSMGEWDTFVCEKGHFEGVARVRFLRENILRAEKCKDYKPAK